MSWSSIRKITVQGLHRGRPTKTRLLVLQTIFITVSSAGYAFHSARIIFKKDCIGSILSMEPTRPL